jgi:hypothetical protein
VNLTVEAGASSASTWPSWLPASGTTTARTRWWWGTFPQELADVRSIVATCRCWRGIGAQGGDVEATVRAGRTAAGAG